MATVLKSNGETRSPGFRGVAGFNLEDLAQVAARQLEAAQREAQAILETARRDAQRLRTAAHHEGLAQGRAAAAKEADGRLATELRQQLDTHLPQFEATLRQIADRQAQWLSQFRESLLGTSLAVAERIVRTQLALDPELLVRWAAEAIHAVGSARSLVVAVHPETLAQIGEPLERLLSLPGLPEAARIEPDESVEPAGVVVRQEGGAVDLQLTTQLQRLAELLGGREAGPAP